MKAAWATSPTAKVCVRAFVRAVRRMSPRRRHFVVYGWPSIEGNSIEVARFLARASDHPVYYFTDDATPESVSRHLGQGHGVPVPLIVRRRTVRAFTLYASAAGVFYTHGLFHSPPTGPHKFVVNLWHGDGPKANPRTKENMAPRADYVVSGAALFAEEKCRFFHVANDKLMLTGNPRCDQFARPASDDELSRLGIRPESPFVVILPTYRRAKAVGTRRAWSDVGEGSPEAIAGESGRMEVPSLMEIASDRGVQLVVKPHPQDAEDYASLGMMVLDQQALVEQGVGLYRALARASGLVTDYSSVWVDFLTLDRPIAFTMDDLEEYAKGRGFNVPDPVGILPGPVLSSKSACEAFIEAVTAPSHDKYDMLRFDSASRIGLIAGRHCTERLMVELASRGALRYDDGRVSLY